MRMCAGEIEGGTGRDAEARSPTGNGTAFGPTIETGAPDAVGLLQLERRGPPPLQAVPATSRILVTDDDPRTRALIASALRQGGYDVVEAGNGLDAIDQLVPLVWTHRARFQAIVSDIGMPNLAGLDLLAALRCARIATPVILMAATGDEEVRAEAFALGVTVVLDKPFTPDALHAAVRKALSSSRIAATREYGDG